MRIKITPTLEQLKKRPALWVFTMSDNNVEPRITYPDGSMDVYNYKGPWWVDDPVGYFLHKHARKTYKFVAWL